MNKNFLLMKKKKINKLIESLVNKKNYRRIWIFDFKHNFLSYFGIGKYLKYIVDDNKQKQNKLTPGDLIKIFPSSEISKQKVDYLIIFAWIHTDKIIKNFSSFVDEGGKFIRIYPEIEIFPK